MAVDSATTIAGFDLSKPSGSDPRSELDNNLRHVKTVLQGNFPNVGGTVTATHTQLSYVTGVTSAIQTQLDAKGAHAGQTWTGTQNFTGATVTVATKASSYSGTEAVNGAMVQAAIASVNSQTALSTSIDASASVSISVGQHIVCTNASSVTATLPPSPAAGDRCRLTFSNTLYSNVINPGALKIFGAAGARNVNAKNASPEFIYTNSTVGWVY